LVSDTQLHDENDTRIHLNLNLIEPKL